MSRDFQRASTDERLVWTALDVFWNEYDDLVGIYALFQPLPFLNVGQFVRLALHILNAFDSPDAISQRGLLVELAYDPRPTSRRRRFQVGISLHCPWASR